MGLNKSIQLLSFKSQANEQHSTRKGETMESYRITYADGNWETVLTKNIERAVERRQRRETRKIVRVEKFEEVKLVEKFYYNSRMFG